MFCHLEIISPRKAPDLVDRVFAQGIAEIAHPILRGIRLFMATQGQRFCIGQLSRLGKRNPRLNKIVGVKQVGVPDLVQITTVELIELKGFRIKTRLRRACRVFGAPTNNAVVRSGGGGVGVISGEEGLEIRLQSPSGLKLPSKLPPFQSRCC